MRTAILSVALTLCGAAPALAQVGLGPDFVVNAYTTGDQRWQSVAADGSGAFVVAWESAGQDGNYSGIYAQRYSASGAPVGPEFRVNSFTTGGQDRPAVAMTRSGAFVIVWGGIGDVWGQRYDAAGAPQGAEFRVNSYEPAVQRFPAVAMDDSGNFAVAWASNPQDGSGYGVVARTFDAAGAPRSADVVVNTYVTGTQWFPKIASNGTGAFVVAWWSAGQDGDGYGIFARRFAGATVPIGGEFAVNTYTTGVQQDANVAIGADGRFMIGWTGQRRPGRRYAASSRGRTTRRATPVGPEFLVNTFTSLNQSYPALAATGGGEFLVAWSDQQEILRAPPASSGRRFSAAGQPLDDEFPINTYIPVRQAFPTLAASTAGRFVVSWQSNQQDGGGYGIAARRMLADLIFEDGFESGTPRPGRPRQPTGATSRVGARGAQRHGLRPAGAGGRHRRHLRRGRAAGQREPLPGALLFRPERLRSGRSARPVPHADPARPGGGAGAAHGRNRSAPARRRVQPDGPRAPRRRLPGQHRLLPDPERPPLRGDRLAALDQPHRQRRRFELSIDGTSVSVLTGLDNSLSSVDFVRLGALSVKAGASGRSTGTSSSRGG